MKTKDYESLSDLGLAVEVNNAVSAINNALSAVVGAQQAYTVVLVELALRQQRRLTKAFARYEPTPDEPVEEPSRTPPDIEALVTLVYEKFPRTGHSNPKHFALVNGCSGEDGDQDGLRVNALRHAFTKCVQLGFLEKLVEGEEYCWCGPLEVAGADLEEVSL